MTSSPAAVLLVDTAPFPAGTESLDAGFSVTTASSLSEAKILLKAQPVDLILLNPRIGSSGGGESPLEDLLHSFPGIPLVTLHREEDENACLNAIRKGAQDSVVRGRCGPEPAGRILRHAIERHRAQKEAMKCCEALRAETRELEKFADSLGHRIKNDVLVIKRIVELASLNPSFVLENAVMLASSCDHLMSLVNRLLDHARAGKPVARKANLHVAPLVTRLFEKTRPADVDAELLLGGHLPLLFCDPLRMEKVFAHLLENSFLYRGTGPRRLTITLDGREEGEVDILTFRDNGSGLETGEVGRVFESWYSSRKEEHLGLGLALVKKTMESHGGSVSVTSEGKDLGVEFTLTLPREPGPADHEGARQAPGGSQDRR